jgi:RNA polymerase sigma-70 factor (ECF subfamily)
MDSTSASLIERLRRPEDQAAWARFVELYTPLLCSWARRWGLRGEDMADLVQDVLTLLVQKLPDFSLDPAQRFRGWLWTVALNKCRDFQRKRAAAPARRSAALLDDLPGPDGTASVEEAEYRSYLVARALRLMQADFQPSTWKACWEHVVCGRPAAEVAAELNLSVGAVYVARSRVLARLREELAGLLD